MAGLFVSLLGNVGIGGPGGEGGQGMWERWAGRIHTLTSKFLQKWLPNKHNMVCASFKLFLVA